MKKRFLSLILVLAMMVGVFTPLMTLADTTDHPVTVPTGDLSADQLSATKPEKTEVDIYKLTTQQNYKKGAPWEHTGGKIADTTTLGTDVKPLEGAKFTFYKLKGTDDVENEKILELLKANSSKFETVDQMSDLIEKGANGLKLKPDDTSEEPKNIDKNKLEKVKADDSEGLTEGETAATNKQGLVTVKLKDGYYWAIESHKPDKVTGQIAVPFALTLPLMNGKDVEGVKAGTQYLKKLYIYPKNVQTDDVQIDKDHANYDEKTGKWVDKDGKEVPSSTFGIKYNDYQRKKEIISKQLGQDAPFQSSTVLPRNYTFDSFSWVDTMSEGLTYNKNLVVTIDYTDADGKTIKKDQPFINADNKAEFVTERDNGYDVKVTKDKVKDTLVEYLKRGPVTFHFKYSAKVNNSAAVDKPQSNSITFIPKEPKGVPDVKSKDGKIEIKKSWKKKGEDVTPANDNLTYYVEDTNGKTVASVTVSKTDQAGKVYTAANGITFTVGANFGSGTFEGLPEGSYKVREAVDGYLPTYEVPSAVPGSDAQAPAGKVDIINEDNPDVKKPSEPKVIVHGKKFVKMDQLGNARLFGAVFAIRNKSKAANNPDKDKFLVVKSDKKRVEELDAVKNAKKALDEKIDEYNNLTAEQQKKQKADYDTAIDGLQKTYNDAVIAARTDYTWVAGDAKGNPPEEAYKLISDGQGRFEITGLYAGDYELVELTAPVGYAKLENPVPFTVKDGTYAGDKTKEVKYTVKDDDSGDKKAKDGYGQRVDNKKVTIPQTGGIGTIIFTAIGLAIMASAVIAIKKRQATEAR